MRTTLALRACARAAPARRTGAWRCARRRGRPTAPACDRACRRRAGSRRRRPAPRRASRGTSVLVPCSTVIGRSVFSRIVRHGTPSAVVSSCTPPESVSTRRAWRAGRPSPDSPAAAGSAIAQRGEPLGEAEPLDVGARARMHRPDQRQPLADPAQDVEQLAPGSAGSSTLDGRCSVTTPKPGGMATQVRRRTLARQRRRRLDGPGQGRMQRVDHQVADEMHPVGRDALACEVVVGAALGRVEQVGDLVGQDAVDLLRHAAVEAAQPGLDVHHRRRPSWPRPGRRPASS